MERIPTHPAIIRAERTGYPYGYQEERLIGYCEYCGRPIYEYDNYEERGFIDPALICEDCQLMEDDIEKGAFN